MGERCDIIRLRRAGESSLDSEKKIQVNKRYNRLLLALAAIFGLGLVLESLFPTAGATPAAQKRKEEREAEREPKPEGRTAIAVEVKLVNVDVTVTDSKGNLITGLKAENFTIYEDGVRQQISHFSPVEAPMTVVLVVDFSRQAVILGDYYFGNEIWDAIVEFSRVLRPDDWVAVVAYDMKPEILTDFTRDRNQLYQALRRLTFPAFSESNLSDAVVFVLERVEEVEGKVGVVFLSSGLDTFSKVTYDEALRKARNSHAVIYSVGIGQNLRVRYEPYIAPEQNIELLQSDNRLRSFAEITGGVSYFPRFVSELPSIMRDIAQRLRHQYSLGYVPTNTKKDGKFRKIKVEVKADIDGDGKPDKLKVNHRQGYYAPKEG